MAFLNEFRCEVCGAQSENPVRWLVIRNGDSQLSVFRWDDESAHASDARHLCGEADAQIYISRWLEATLAGRESRPTPGIEAAGMVVPINPNLRLCRDRHHGKADPPGADRREHGSVQRGRL